MVRILVLVYVPGYTPTRPGEQSLACATPSPDWNQQAGTASRGGMARAGHGCWGALLGFTEGGVRPSMIIGVN